MAPTIPGTVFVFAINVLADICVAVAQAYR
jgi:hypothetical protein